MTDVYERLKEGPQTDIDRSQLNYRERAELRAIDVRGTAGLAQSNNPGRFTTVYYLDGDEQAAAERFAEVNADLLAAVDFTARNVLQTSLSRELYDLILDASGQRDILKYPTVVYERRPDGTVWLVDRDRYETQIDRRYTTNEPGSARAPPAVSLPDLFQTENSLITEQTLAETALEGDIRQVLDYFRAAEEYPCQPVSTDDGQLAVRKSSQQPDPDE